MARKSVDNLQKHTLNLRAGDMDTLAQLFPRQNPSVLVRSLVSKYVDAMLRSRIPAGAVDEVSETLESHNE